VLIPKLTNLQTEIWGFVIFGCPKPSLPPQYAGHFQHLGCLDITEHADPAHPVKLIGYFSFFPVCFS
jgi:hypothetical protein